MASGHKIRFIKINMFLVNGNETIGRSLFIAYFTASHTRNGIFEHLFFSRIFCLFVRQGTILANS